VSKDGQGLVPSRLGAPPPPIGAREGWYEKLYHMLLGNIPFSLILIDSALRVTSANRNFIDKARRTEANTIGMRVREVFPDAILEFTRLEDKISRVFLTGVTLPGAHMTYRGPGVALRVYFYTVIPIKRGLLVEHAMLVMDDVTEKFQLSQQARMAERHLASVVESAHDLVVSTDPLGCITSWNPAAERISGHQIAGVRGRLLSEFCVAEQGPDMAAIIQQLCDGGSVEFHEFKLIAQSGASIPVDWSFSRIHDDSGQLSGFVAVGRDLSERRALEQHLFQSEKLAALGVMAGGIAHELRNPLSVSYSAAQFLLDPAVDTDFQQTCVKKIIDGIERSSLIIENLLRFARPPSGSQAQSLNLVSLVRETLSVLTPQAKVQKINLLEVYALPTIPVAGNANLLQQVIMNLVLNAFQAMPEGGDVHVSVGSGNGHAIVHVRDTGCGMSPAQIGLVFDPFFTTRPVGQGTGLGLSICHTIVKQHGGSIGVASSIEGQGSLLVISLPLVTES
jgi:PAS domain S-box-containing protein